MPRQTRPPPEGLFAERLDRLFRTVHPKDRGPYTPAEAAEAINQAAGPAACLPSLRRRPTPGPRLAQPRPLRRREPGPLLPRPRRFRHKGQGDLRRVRRPRGMPGLCSAA